MTGGLKDLYHRIIRGKVLQTPDGEAHTNEKGHFWPGHDGPVVLAQRYHITEVLNTRGQSAVLVFAEDLFNRNKVVVIKILHTTYFNIGAQEAECLRRLAVSDPLHVSHTVKLLNTFVFGGHFCMVFESLSPHPITEVFGDLHLRNCTHLHKVKKLSLQLLVVLGFLRQQNTIHADLKPENILLKHANDLSSVTVIDFGNSIQHVHKEVSLYYREFDVQTLLYRAPEVMFGIPFGTEIDMWSLGCILAELYLGRPLFFGKTKPELLTSITSVLGPLPKEVFQRGKYSRELATFTEDVEQEDATARILECLEGAKDYAFANFLSQLFRYDPDERLNPSEAAQHPFLAQELCVSFLLPPSTKRLPTSILLNSKVYRHGVRISSEVKRQNPSTYDLLVIGTDRKICDHGRHDTRVAEVQPYKQEVDTDHHSKGQKGGQEERGHTDWSSTNFSPPRKRLHECQERNDSGFYERMDMVKSEDSNEYAKRCVRKPAFDLSKNLFPPQQTRTQTRSRSPKHARGQTRSRSPMSQSDRHSQSYISYNSQTVTIVSGRNVVSTSTKHPDTLQSGSQFTQDWLPRTDRDNPLSEGRRERNSLQCPVKVLVKQYQSPSHLALREQKSGMKLNQSCVSTRKGQSVEMSPKRSRCSSAKSHISETNFSEDLGRSQQQTIFAGQHQQLQDLGGEVTEWKTVKQSPGQIRRKMKRKQLEDERWRKIMEGDKHEGSKRFEEETNFHGADVKDRIGIMFEDERECSFLDRDRDDVNEDLKTCHIVSSPQYPKRDTSSHDQYKMEKLETHLVNDGKTRSSPAVVTSGTLLVEDKCENIDGHRKIAGNNCETLRRQKSDKSNNNIMEIILSPKSKISRFTVSPNEEDDMRSHEIIGPKSDDNEIMKSDTYKYETAFPERNASSRLRLTHPAGVDEDFILSPRKSKLETRLKIPQRGKNQSNMAGLEKEDRRRLFFENAHTEADEQLSGEEAKQMMFETTVPLRGGKSQRSKVGMGRGDRSRLLKADTEEDTWRSWELSDEDLSEEEARKVMYRKTVSPRMGKTQRNKVNLGKGDRRLLNTDTEAGRSWEPSDEELSGDKARQMMFKTTVSPRGKTKRNKIDLGRGDKRRLLIADTEAGRSWELSDEELSEEKARQMIFEMTVSPIGKTQKNKFNLGRGDRRRLLNADSEAVRSCELSDEDLSEEKAKKVMFKRTVLLGGKTQTNKVNSQRGDRRRLLNADSESVRSCELSDEDLSGEDAKRMMMETTMECEAMAEFCRRKSVRVTMRNMDIVEHNQSPCSGEQLNVSAEKITMVKHVDGERNWRTVDKRTHGEKKRRIQGIDQGYNLQRSVVEKKDDDERWRKKFEDHKRGVVTSKDTEFSQASVEKSKDMWLQFSFVDVDADVGAYKSHAQREMGYGSSLDAPDVQNEDVHHSASSDGEEVIMSVVEEHKSVLIPSEAPHSRQERTNVEQVVCMPARKYSVKQTNSCISSSEKSKQMALKVKNSTVQRSPTVQTEPFVCPISQGSNRKERLERGRDIPDDRELEFSGNINFKQLRSNSSSQCIDADKSKPCSSGSGKVDKLEKRGGSLSDPACFGIASRYNLSEMIGHPSSENHHVTDENGLESDDDYESNDKHDQGMKVNQPKHHYHSIDNDYKVVMEQTVGINSNNCAMPQIHRDHKLEVGLTEEADRCTTDRQMSHKPAAASQEEEQAHVQSEDMFNVSPFSFEASVQEDHVVMQKPTRIGRKKSHAKRKLKFAKKNKLSFQDVLLHTEDISQRGSKLWNKTFVRGTKRQVSKTMRGSKPIDTDDLKSPCRKGFNTPYVGGSTKNPKSTLSSLKTKSLTKRVAMQGKGKRKSSQDVAPTIMEQLPEEIRGNHGEKRMRDGERKSTKQHYAYQSNTYRNIISNVSNHSDSGDSHDSGVSKVCVQKRRRTDVIRSKNSRSRANMEELPPLASKGVAEVKYSDEEPAVDIQPKKMWKNIELLKNSVKRFPHVNKRSRKTNSSPRHAAKEDQDLMQSSHVMGPKMVVEGVSSPSSTPGRRKKSQDADDDEILFLIA
ncbi:uncharacterized protein [Haliotis cracherodii]